MKLELERQEFMKSWQLVTRISVAHVLVTAFEDDVILEATDLKTSVKCKAKGVNVLDIGSALIPVAIFTNMLKKAASENLILEVSSSRGILNAGRNKTRFSLVPVEEFPELPLSENATLVCELATLDFAKLVNEGSIAASQPMDFPRYVGSCLLKTSEGFLIAASTDGKRLAVANTPCEKIESSEEMLLLALALREVAKVLAGYPDKNVKIFADSSIVWFQVEDVEFSVRKVDATFPQYTRILNDEVYSILEINSLDLITTLERVDIIARTNPAHIMSMVLTPDNNEVTITARSQDCGTVREILSTTVELNYLNVGFNVGYFLDGLKALGASTAVIEFSGEETQARMKRKNDDSFLYMFMPARLTASDRISEDEIKDFLEGE